MYIIGTKLFHHDSAIFILDFQNKEIFALSTERITRVKHDPSFITPILTGINKDIFKKAEYIVYNPLWERDSLVKNFFYRYGINAKIEKKEHHLCHAASAYYFSPFYGKPTIVFTLDGKGDGKYGTLFLFNKNNYEKISFFKNQYLDNKKIEFYETSIGILYLKFTSVLGLKSKINEKAKLFKRESEIDILKALGNEGKTEALAAYGEPDEKLYSLLKDGYSVDKENLCWNHNFEVLRKLHNIDFLKKWKEKVGDKNFAATIQRWLEDTVVELLNIVYEKYKIPRLAMAGGVVANVIMNLNIFERTPFKEIYIFPAMGDDGTAAGAAVLKAIELGYDISWLKEKEMPYWGPSYTKEEVAKELEKERWKDKIKYTYIGENWQEMAAEMIADGKIIAVFQGRMEFGPRALGNRSVLADPRDPYTREKLNKTIKRRPWFQPFCPSVLEEERERLFEKSYKNKHMTIAFRMKKEFWDKLPSAIHIDGTARPQFVEEKDNPNFYRILKKFKERTGYGIVVNTSFNLHGRTIVMTPEDALKDFIDCNIDALFIEGYLIERK